MRYYQNTTVTLLSILCPEVFFLQGSLHSVSLTSTRFLTNKTALLLHVNLNKPKTICLTETWVKPDIPDNRLESSRIIN